MYSPSAELNAYILEYKAKKSLSNSPYNNPSPIPYNNHARYSISPSKLWLQEVITMPNRCPLMSEPDLYSVTKGEINCYGPKRTDEGSITEWLDKIDEKIAKRFPKLNPSPTDDDNLIHSTSNSTMELLAGDPETGIMFNSNDSCHCPSYDSHPNMVANFQNASEHSDGNVCVCQKMESTELLVGEHEQLSTEQLCFSCIENDHNTSVLEMCYKPKELNISVPLPSGYGLIENYSIRKHKKNKKIHTEKNNKLDHNGECFRKNLGELYNTMVCSCPDSSNSSNMEKTLTPTEVNSPTIEYDKVSNFKPSVPQTPDSAHIMRLLELAITQLQEVKVAVEDNTVSAITTDISGTSQVSLSDFTPDVSYAK